MSKSHEIVESGLAKVPVFGEAISKIYAWIKEDLNHYHQQTRMSDFELLMREFEQHASDRGGMDDDAVWYEERLQNPEVVETLLMEFRAMERAPGRYARLSMAKTFGIYFGSARPVDKLFRAVGRFLEAATDDMVASAKYLSELVRRLVDQAEVTRVEARVIYRGDGLNLQVHVYSDTNRDPIPHAEPTRTPRTVLFRMIAALKNAGIGEDVMGGGTGIFSGGGVIAFPADGLDHVLSLADLLVVERNLEQKILSMLPDDGGLNLFEMHTKLDTDTIGGLKISELREALGRLKREGQIELSDVGVVRTIVAD